MKTKDYFSRQSWLKGIKGFVFLYSGILGGIFLILEVADFFGLESFKSLGIWGCIGLLLIPLPLIAVIRVFFTERPRRKLINIETELQKTYKNIKPERIRKGGEGPYWIDFEQGSICERREVDEIISKLGRDHIQVVKGDPASGKSVLLKHIGFKLATQEKYRVYYIGCKVKSEKDIKTYFEEAREIDDAKTLIIIDDCHLQKYHCEAFLEQYQKQDIKNTKVLIGTRPIDERRNARIDKLSKTEIDSQSVSKDIITTYLKKQYGLSDDKLEEASWLFSEYEDNLLALSWALDAFQLEKGGITLKDIYKDVKKWIKEIDERNKPRTAEDIFLPLSILNRYEIPVEKHFLTDTENGLGIEEQKIIALLDQHEILLQEVIGTIRMEAVTLPHSRLAELIFETYWETPLGEDIIRDIIKISENGGKDKFEKSFLLHYLCHSDLLYYIDTNSLFFQDFVVSLIEQNLSNDSLKKKLEGGIQHTVDSDMDLGEIEERLHGYLHMGLSMNAMSELVQGLNLDNLSQRIIDTDIGRISSFFGTTQGHFLKKMMEKINEEKLKSKVEDDLWALSGVLGALANTDKANTRCLLDMVGIPHINELFRNARFDSAAEMGKCYGTIAGADAGLARELAMIVNARMKEMPEPVVDEIIPDQAPLGEVGSLIQGTADTQSLYGSHYVAMETLLGALEELLKEKIQQQTWYYVDMSGEDYTEQEAREAVLEDIKPDLWECFGYWVDAETFERTLSRFGIT